MEFKNSKNLIFNCTNLESAKVYFNNQKNEIKCFISNIQLILQDDLLKLKGEIKLIGSGFYCNLGEKLNFNLKFSTKKEKIMIHGLESSSMDSFNLMGEHYYQVKFDQICILVDEFKPPTHGYDRKIIYCKTSPSYQKQMINFYYDNTDNHFKVATGRGWKFYHWWWKSTFVSKLGSDINKTSFISPDGLAILCMKPRQKVKSYKDIYSNRVKKVIETIKKEDI
jgi:hypothetical protein